MTLSATMRAVVLTGYDGLDQFEYHGNGPMSASASGAVRLRGGACGLNNTACNMRIVWFFRSLTTELSGMRGRQDFASAEAAYT
jgi:hypothetical protein